MDATFDLKTFGIKRDPLDVTLSIGDMIRQHEYECDLQIAISEFGSVEAWRDHLNLTRRLDPDRKIAKAIESLIYNGHYSPQGTLSPRKKALILKDKNLAVYFISVARHDGWSEERRRISEVQKMAVRAEKTSDRLLAFEHEAIYYLLPTYRYFGKLLIDQGIDTMLDDVVEFFAEKHPDLWS
ncbi:MAG: hypothetical protein WCJ64_09160 [Rhodospirillaceae bacterium]